MYYNEINWRGFPIPPHEAAGRVNARRVNCCGRPRTSYAACAAGWRSGCVWVKPLLRNQPDRKSLETLILFPITDSNPRHRFLTPPLNCDTLWATKGLQLFGWKNEFRILAALGPEGRVSRPRTIFEKVAANRLQPFAFLGVKSCGIRRKSGSA